MRGFRKPAAGLAGLVLLACAGCSSGGGGSSDAAPARTPGAGSSSTSYAPYVSATSASPMDTAGSPGTYNLAFVIADGGDCTPSWDGVHEVGDAGVKARIDKLTDTGASLRVSFGGASGKELASVCDSASELAAAYGEALDAAGTTLADFDVEGDQLKDADSVALRSEAIALLQKERDGLSVSFTLPVMPSGLDEDGLALLESANDHGVEVATVDIMTMNYAESYDDDMGDYALAAAEKTHDQLVDVFGQSSKGAWQGLALTSMLGVQDVDNETFTLDDAAEVRAFAEKKGIAWVSMWATFRDRECGEDAAADDPLINCSGVEQENGAFGKVFAG
ncbi:chitinase [Streptomyces sp. NPDC008313]|uniref:chitinase n=1 Tax=Streptomyces sp. NPDC008313 TaxID=3364826 RepID=UPI0036E84950